LRNLLSGFEMKILDHEKEKKKKKKKKKKVLLVKLK
jgi:hypothetical protein